MAGLVSAWRAWNDRRVTFRALRQQQDDDDHRFASTVKDGLTYALMALQREDQTQAATLWTDLLTRHPRITRASPLALDVLLGLRRFDEAEHLMRQGQKKTPGDPHFARGLALVSFSRGDMVETAKRAELIRDRFPAIMEGYTLGVQALAANGRLTEADELARLATKKLPNNWLGFLDFANLAVHQQHWEDAINRWKMIIDNFPQHKVGHLGYTQALTRLFRYDEAEEAISSALQRFPTDLSLFIEFARCKQARGDIAAAIERWEVVLKRFPQQIQSYSETARAFEAMGEHTKAVETLREAMRIFPADAQSSAELARMFQGRRDFAAAAEIWSLIRARFPDFQEAYLAGAAALRELGQAEEARAVLRTFAKGPIIRSLGNRDPA